MEACPAAALLTFVSRSGRTRFCRHWPPCASLRFPRRLLKAARRPFHFSVRFAQFRSIPQVWPLVIWISLGDCYWEELSDLAPQFFWATCPVLTISLFPRASLARLGLLLSSPEGSALRAAWSPWALCPCLACAPRCRLVFAPSPLISSSSSSCRW